MISLYELVPPSPLGLNRLAAGIFVLVTKRRVFSQTCPFSWKPAFSLVSIVYDYFCKHQVDAEPKTSQTGGCILSWAATMFDHLFYKGSIKMLGWEGVMSESPAAYVHMYMCIRIHMPPYALFTPRTVTFKARFRRKSQKVKTNNEIDISIMRSGTKN